MAVAGGTLVLLFWALGDVKTLKSWGGAVSGLFVGSLAMRLTDLIDQMGDLQIKHLGYLRKQKIQYLMVSDKILLLEAALLVLLFVLLKTKAAHFLVKYGRKLLAALVILCVAGVLFYIFPLEDSFGTNRGYIWKRTLANFADYPFLEKLFGCGPNCFLKAMEKNYGTEMRSLYGDPYLDAHNEILQFLAVTGIFGALSYLGLQVSLVRSCIRSYKKEPFAIVGCAGMVAYFMQGLVNNPQVFTTPLYFLFMGVVAAKVRNQDPKSSSKFSVRRLRKS
jgi:O-antigen ligase